MTETSDDRLKARVEGRNSAKELLQLAKEEAMRIVGDGRRPNAFCTFWEEIRDCALEHVPLQPVEPKVIRAKPMTDEQAHEFEKEEIPFGQYKAYKVGSVMELNPVFLYWLANQTFVDDLRRYLANETIARQK